MVDLTSVTGGPVDLAGQHYPNLAISGRTFDPTNPLIVTNGVFDTVQITDSDNIILRSLQIGDHGPSPVTRLTGKAVQIRHSSKVTIEHCEIVRAFVGLVIDSSPDCVIDANNIHELGSDGIHLVNAERARVTRNEIHDWHISGTTHCDAVQPWNDGLGHDADGIVIEDNCVYRGKGTVPQGICLRYYNPASPQFAKRTSFSNYSVRRNLLTGLAFNAIVLCGHGSADENEVISYADFVSKILTVGPGNGVALNSNKAQQYSINGVFSKTAPVGNFLNKAALPSQEVVLVAAWRKRVLGHK